MLASDFASLASDKGYADDTQDDQAYRRGDMTHQESIPFVAAGTSRGDAVMATLVGLRALSDAMDRMHGAIEDEMDMNITDLRALRLLIEDEQRGASVSPHDLARHLRITTASTSKLVDRLESAGHVERHPHPSDRRARVIRLTDHSRRSFFAHFGGHLGTMRTVAEAYTDDELRSIARFMSEMSEALDPR